MASFRCWEGVEENYTRSQKRFITIGLAKRAKTPVFALGILANSLFHVPVKLLQAQGSRASIAVLVKHCLADVSYNGPPEILKIR